MCDWFETTDYTAYNDLSLKTGNGITIFVPIDCNTGECSITGIRIRTVSGSPDNIKLGLYADNGG